MRRIGYTSNRKYNRELVLQHKEEIITRQTSRYIVAYDERWKYDRVEQNEPIKSLDLLLLLSDNEGQQLGEREGKLVVACKESV